MTLRRMMQLGTNLIVFTSLTQAFVADSQLASSSLALIQNISSPNASSLFNLGVTFVM